MDVQVVREGDIRDEHDVVLLPICADSESTPEVTRRLLLERGLDPEQTIARAELVDVGTSCLVLTPAAGAAFRLVQVADKDRGPSVGSLRRAAQAAGRSLAGGRVLSALHLALTGDRHSHTRMVAEALLLGAYSYGAYQTRGPRRPLELCALDADAEELRVGSIVGSATNWCRDLVNAPSADKTPEIVAQIAEGASGHGGWTCEVLGPDELVEGGFGGVLGVGAGSVNPPRLITLERGDPSLPVTALVGKGITFDSGGLDLKTLEHMLTMKTDLAGAAVIMAVLQALDALGSDLHVRAHLACAENMLSATSTRPGDVLRHRDGTTTEVVSPDAEGRLVLADALALACESQPARIIDVATLTGSTALGSEVWAVLGNDDQLAQDVVEAGRRSGDPGWQLPLWEGYDHYVRSPVADIKNAALGITWNFGAILGALYLRNFVGRTPWAHLDISATVFRDDASAGWSQGATGTATRALLSLLYDEHTTSM